MTLKRNRKGEWASFWSFVEKVEAEVARLPSWQRGAQASDSQEAEPPKGKKAVSRPKAPGRREDA